MTFRVNQKVVCVDGAAPDAENMPYVVANVERGVIYTIRGFHIEPNVPGVGVYLEEIVNPVIAWNDGTVMEWPFNSCRFRPLTDISFAHEILAKASKRVSA